MPAFCNRNRISNLGKTEEGGRQAGRQEGNPEYGRINNERERREGRRNRDKGRNYIYKKIVGVFAGIN